MPTYEYRCRDCQEPLEVVQSIHDAALTECPRCGGTLRKVFGNVGVVFKGSGFYRTDNRPKGKAAREPGRAEAAKSETKSESGKGDAAKSESTPSSAGAGSSGGTGSGAAATPAPAASKPASTSGTPAK